MLGRATVTLIPVAMPLGEAVWGSATIPSGVPVSATLILIEPTPFISVGPVCRALTDAQLTTNILKVATISLVHLRRTRVSVATCRLET